MPLERCDTLKGAETALEKYSGIANGMNDFNSLTERKRHFERALSEVRNVSAAKSRSAIQRHDVIGKTMEVGR